MLITLRIFFKAVVTHIYVKCRLCVSNRNSKNEVIDLRGEGGNNINTVLVYENVKK